MVESSMVMVPPPEQEMGKLPLMSLSLSKRGVREFQVNPAHRTNVAKSSTYVEAAAGVLSGELEEQAIKKLRDTTRPNLLMSPPYIPIKVWVS